MKSQGQLGHEANQGSQSQLGHMCSQDSHNTAMNHTFATYTAIMKPNPTMAPRSSSSDQSRGLAKIKVMTARMIFRMMTKKRRMSMVTPFCFSGEISDGRQHFLFGKLLFESNKLPSCNLARIPHVHGTSRIPAEFTLHVTPSRYALLATIYTNAE